MKQHSVKEIKDFVRANFEHNYDFYDQYISVNIREKFTDIEVTWEYDRPDFTEVIREKFAEFFETDNIDKYDDVSRSGCDTCDYGSQYGYVIRVW